MTSFTAVRVGTGAGIERPTGRNCAGWRGGAFSARASAAARASGDAGATVAPGIGAFFPVGTLASFAGGASFTAGTAFAAGASAAGAAPAEATTAGSLVALAVDDLAVAFAGALAGTFVSAATAGMGSAALMVSALAADFAAVGFVAAGFALTGDDLAWTVGMLAGAVAFTGATLAALAGGVATRGAAAVGVFPLIAGFTRSTVCADSVDADFTEVFLLGVALTISALAFAVVAAALDVVEIFAAGATFADVAGFLEADGFATTGAAFVGRAEAALADLPPRAGAFFNGDFDPALPFAVPFGDAVLFSLTFAVAFGAALPFAVVPFAVPFGAALAFAGFAGATTRFAGATTRFAADANGAAFCLAGAFALTAGFAALVDFGVVATGSPSSPFGITPGCPERTAQATAITSVQRANRRQVRGMRQTARAIQRGSPPFGILRNGVRLGLLRNRRVSQFFVQHDDRAFMGWDRRSRCQFRWCGKGIKSIETGQMISERGT